MTASLLDGQKVASELLENIQHAVAGITRIGQRAPALAVIRVGKDPASLIYVNHKIKACEKTGMTSLAFELSDTVSQAELIDLIVELNQNQDIDGILVQLPLPEHINPPAVIEKIAIHKDVDGFHPYNLGRLAQGNPALRPCTPFGMIQLLNHYQCSLSGLNAVVVGRSNIVGRPMAYELLLAGCTTTICHSATRDLERHVQQADLVVVATGHYDVVKASWLQPHQIILDVGMHRNEKGTVHGDIHFLEASQKVAWLTPVPGGVGPMTICTLLQNTLFAAGYKLGDADALLT